MLTLKLIIIKNNRARLIISVLISLICSASIFFIATNKSDANSTYYSFKNKTSSFDQSFSPINIGNPALKNDDTSINVPNLLTSNYLLTNIVINRNHTISRKKPNPSETNEAVKKAADESLSSSLKIPTNRIIGAKQNRLRKKERIFYQPPVYTKQARMRNLEGIVSVSFVVDSNGHVIDAKINSSSGSIELDNSALMAVRKWDFPQKNKAVAFRKKSVSFEFVLD